MSAVVIPRYYLDIVRQSDPLALMIFLSWPLQFPDEECACASL
jgi:hypothetical protein